MASRQKNAPRKSATTPYTRPARRSSSILATDEEYQEFIQDERSYNGSQLCMRRIQQNLAVICAKFDRPFASNETDIVDLDAMCIVKDNGAVRAMPDRDVLMGKSLALPDPIDPSLADIPDFDGADEPEEADSLADDDENMDDLIDESDVENDDEDPEEVDDDGDDESEQTDADLELLRTELISKAKVSKQDETNRGRPCVDHTKPLPPAVVAVPASRFKEIQESSKSSGSGKLDLKTRPDERSCSSPSHDPVDRLSALFGRPLLYSPLKSLRPLVNSPASTPPHSPKACRKSFCLNCRKQAQ